jgi:hypothetical protein
MMMMNKKRKTRKIAEINADQMITRSFFSRITDKNDKNTTSFRLFIWFELKNNPFYASLTIQKAVNDFSKTRV